MGDIRLIDKNTDLKKVLHELSWDAMVNGEPYKVFFAYDYDGEYNHSIGGRHDYAWACPRFEEPTYENLIQFDGVACEWGFKVVEKTTSKTKWDETEASTLCVVDILRNGEIFERFCTRDMYYGVAQAQVKLTEYPEHPLDLCCYEYDKKCVGRKIKYKGIPAEIVRFCTGDASIIIKPRNKEDIDEFFSDIHKTDYEIMEDYYDEWKSDGILKVSINSQLIWWFEN